MIKQNNYLIQNYTDSDLQSFAILGDFSNYNVVSNNTKKNKKVLQSVAYTLSDKKQFKKLMNFNKNIENSSKEYSNDDLTDKRTYKVADSFYNESDIQNFKNFPLINSLDSLKYTNKKENSVDIKNNYTVSDLEAFDRIVESNEDSTNNQTAAKNSKSTIDRRSIKIIDFDVLKKQERINNKQRIEKIKVVYFD